MEIDVTDRRGRILKTALELFVNQGLQQTSMAQISKESGVAVGTMYHHFGGKDDLITALFIEINRRLGKAVRFSELEKQLSIKNRFEILWRKAYNFFLQNPQQFLFLDTHNYSPLISSQLRVRGRRNYLEAIRFIKEAIGKEVFMDTDIIFVIRWYYNSVVSLVQLRLADEITVDGQLVETAIQMAWRGITRE